MQYDLCVTDLQLLIMFFGRVQTIGTKVMFMTAYGGLMNYPVVGDN
jgi:hypothetical protein